MRVFGVERVSGQDNNCNSYSQEKVPAGEEAQGRGALGRPQAGFEFSLLPKTEPCKHRLYSDLPKLIKHFLDEKPSTCSCCPPPSHCSPEGRREERGGGEGKTKGMGGGGRERIQKYRVLHLPSEGSWGGWW